MAQQNAVAHLTPAPAVPRTEDPGPLQAAHTPNFPQLLRQLGASLLVTTYQAGRLVMVRDEGDHLNTHYRSFQSPMGLALADGGARLARCCVTESHGTIRTPGRNHGCHRRSSVARPAPSVVRRKHRRP
jgi:hypothetical protein